MRHGTMGTHRSGFAVAILLVALVLLGVFVLVATHVYEDSMKAVRRTSDVQNELLRLDGMLRQIRQDVWSAREIKGDGGEAVLTQGPGATITWTSDSAGLIRRIEGTDRRQWQLKGLSIGFAKCDDGLLLVQKDPAAARQPPIVLMSQWLTGRANP